MFYPNRSGISTQDRLLSIVTRLEWFYRTGHTLPEYPGEVESGPLEQNFAKPNGPEWRADIDSLRNQMALLEKTVTELNSDTGLAISQMADHLLRRSANAE